MTIPARATGMLVEDGISKAERTEFLRMQREERNANRKKGLRFATARTTSSIGSCASNGLKNTKTSAPAVVPFTGMGGGVQAASLAPVTPPFPAMNGGVPAQVAPTMAAIGQQGIAGGTRTPPPPPSSTGEQQSGASGRGVSSPSVNLAPAVTARVPPPRMFNPAAVPPPTAPPTAATRAQTLVPRHPSMSFSVDATVERAMKQATQDASLAERRATLWKSRFREVIVWTASFVVMAFASDRNVKGC